ncbi:MAG: Type 1 glutamine amidotransferase-like domain-containing protein [archaeon]
MKKLILTSSGLDNPKLIKEFLNLISKPINKLKILIIFGVKTKEERFYVEESIKELIKIGINKENIFEVNINKDVIVKSYKGFEVIYFCGGNTYYLLDRIRKTGIDKLIKNSVKKGILYLGVSAGSIIAGKSIEIAGWGIEGDINEVNLKNLSGLKFTNIAIFPHYKDKLKKEVIEFKAKVDYPVKALRDGESIVIIGNMIKELKW